MRLVRASLLGLAVAGAVGVPIAVIAMVGLGALAGQRAGLVLAAGESHDGLPLRGGPQGGQLLPVQANAAPGTSDDSPASAGAADVPATATTVTTATGATPAQTALKIRQGCAWGQPGRNPYRGSTEQALTAAGLPAEVVQQIAAMRQGGQKTGRLQISSAAIRSDDGARQFDPGALAMSFGNTLCLHSRVNFAPGHTEPADLYEAKDAQGRLYAVMVPDVCGNVTVLGPRNKRGVVAGMAGLLAQRSVAVAALAEALLDDTNTGTDTGTNAGAANGDGSAAPGSPGDASAGGSRGDASAGGSRPTARSSGKVDAGAARPDAQGYDLTQGAPDLPVHLGAQGPLGWPLAGTAAPAIEPGDGGTTAYSRPAPLGWGAATLAGLTGALLPRSVVVPALQGLAVALAQRSESLARLAVTLGDREAPGAVQVLRKEVVPQSQPQAVPEPGTLACVLAALVALVGLRMGSRMGLRKPRR